MPKIIFPPFNEKYVRSTHRSAEVKSFLHIYGAGIVYPDTRYEFSKPCDSYLFEYVVSGAGYIGNKAETVRVTAGDCMVTAIDKYIRYGADKKDPYVKMWFSVTGDFIKPLFEACLSPDTDYVIRRVNVYPLFEKMLTELEGNPKDNVDVLSKIILEILLAVSGRIIPDTVTDITRGSQIKQYIDNFFLDGADIKRAAEHLGISERSAVKAFGDEFGISPSKYIRKKKLQYSIELLEHTSKSVYDIAQILHYCDQSYFSTDFKKEYGIYPSEHREKVRASRKKH